MIKEYAKRWNRDESNNFAVACYDSNSIDELEQALKNGPDDIDMAEWGLAAAEWMAAVEAALSELRTDLE